MSVSQSWSLIICSKIAEDLVDNCMEELQRKDLERKQQEAMTTQAPKFDQTQKKKLIKIFDPKIIIE